ncbi:hypothetical protein WT97_02000 [Burkholderia sp. MSMB1459WGS]|nr:hypothetical protein WT24_18075 [Burkholderia sp. MSMB1078WGS]KWO42428.1 hypothetical protein WT97_02000 [Burkholderia sp. MSMB1459WGS]
MRARRCFVAFRSERVARFAIVTDLFLYDIAGRVAAARAAIERQPGAMPQAIHPFGSTLDGGLKLRGDIDLLATVAVRPDEAAR